MPTETSYRDWPSGYDIQPLIKDATRVVLYSVDTEDIDGDGIQQFMKLVFAALEQAAGHIDHGGQRLADFTALAPGLVAGILSDCEGELDERTLAIIVRTLLLVSRTLVAPAPDVPGSDPAPPPLVPALMAAAVDAYRQGFTG